MTISNYGKININKTYTSYSQKNSYDLSRRRRQRPGLYRPDGLEAARQKSLFQAAAICYNKRRISYLQYYIGCSGWSYSAWQGAFYPSNMDNSSDWLKFYSSVFDYVEIDSSFYRTPNVFTVKNWFKRTPENFKFTAKFPKVITHDKRLKDVSKELGYFFQAMLPLKDKTLALLIQLPP